MHMIDAQLWMNGATFEWIRTRQEEGTLYSSYIPFCSLLGDFWSSFPFLVANAEKKVINATYEKIKLFITLKKDGEKAKHIL